MMTKAQILDGKCMPKKGTNNFTTPKRRFWKVKPAFPNAFPGEALFKGVSTGYIRFSLNGICNNHHTNLALAT
jgi:hypothetical protein